MAEASLERWVERLAGHRVGVLGQPVLDRYLFGVTHRISREAPVLIVRQESEHLALGGAANTAANLAGLGADGRLIGPVGDDPEADAVARLCRELRIDPAGLVRGASSATVTKTRVLAGGLHTTRQQMLRIDREPEASLSAEGRERLYAAGTAAFGALNAVIISDYGDSSLVDVWRELGREARRRGLPVIVDSRHALLEFGGVTAVTPNEPEAETALGRTIRTRADAEAAALEIRDRLGLEAVLLTRGREGMIVAARDRAPVHLRAVGGEAVDVTGAGDTVAATFALALAAGADVTTAARLGNAAASVVVQLTGTAAITSLALRRAITAEEDPR